MSDKEKSIRTFGELKRLLEAADAEPSEKPASISEKADDPPGETTPFFEDDWDVDLSSASGDEAVRQQSRIDRENLEFLNQKLADVERREREVANLEMRLKRVVSQQVKAKSWLDARSEELASAQEELRTAKEKLHADQKRLADIAAEEKRVAAKVKTFKARDEKLKKAEAAIKKKQTAARKLRADLREAIEQNEVLDRRLRSANRKISRLTREAEEFAESLHAIEHAEFLADWMLENASAGDAVPWPAVVVVGSGPFDETDFWNFLVDRGVEACETNTEDVPVMIVGRDGWTEEQLEMQIAAQQGGTLKVYSQEMALIALASGSDPFDVADEDDLQELAGDHPALQFLKEGELRWPLFTVAAIPEEFDPFGGKDKDEEPWPVDESPLKKMGYTVGVTAGLAAVKRRAILSEAFLDEIPPVHSDEYMRDWGRPRTRRRLWRIAHHLAWLANSWRHMPSHVHAVSDWATDLAMLEKKFFKPWMRFKWPKATVPGARRTR